MRYHAFLFKEDAIWGEQEVVRFRWVLVAAVLVLVGYIFYQGNTERALVSLSLALCYIAYNIGISFLTKKFSQATWVSYISSFIDVTILSAHIFNYSYFFSPIAASTAASLFLYPILIALSVLRYNGKLVIFTTAYVVFCSNFVYFTRLEDIDPELISSVASAGPEGAIYRSVYFILMGYFMFSIPKMINRLVVRQNEVNNERREIEIKLALETQRKELAMKNLYVEQQLSNQLNKQNLIIENQNLSLERAISTRDKLFSIIGHDLRSPFCLQSSLSEYLIHDFQNIDREAVLENIYAINKTANDGLNLLANLIDWSKTQSDSLKAVPVDVNLYTITETVIYQQSEVCKSKQLAVINRIDKCHSLRLDEHMCDTILRNLFSNAIKFTKKEGCISFNSSVDDGICNISIVDTGVGMTSDQIENIYSDSSYQSTIGTDNEKGTGLGLVLCKEMVEKNRGTISIKSELGKGTTIVISFPY